MPDNYEIQSAIEEHLRDMPEYRDLKEEAEAEHKDIDEAWSDASDYATDTVGDDLIYYVQEWMEKHGCQIITMVREKLDEQEPDIDSSIERLENAINANAKALGHYVAHTEDDEELMDKRIRMFKADIKILKDQLADLTEDEDEDEDE